MKRLIFTFLALLFLNFYGFSQNSNCPIIEVTGGGFVSANTAMYFTANVANTPTSKNIEYEWSVSVGKIVSGQGNAVIAVNTEGLHGQNITATVKIKGLPSDCVSEASETGSVFPIICGLSVDEFRNLSANDEKARLDAFFIGISNTPLSLGFIILQRDLNDKDAQVRKRLQRILNYIKFRKFSKENFIFALPRKEADYTELWRVPPGAELPECKDCEIIYGKDLD